MSSSSDSDSEELLASVSDESICQAPAPKLRRPLQRFARSSATPAAPSTASKLTRASKPSSSPRINVIHPKTKANRPILSGPRPGPLVRIISRLTFLESKVKALESKLREVGQKLRSHEKSTTNSINQLMKQKLGKQSFTMTLAPVPDNIQISRIEPGKPNLASVSSRCLENLQKRPFQSIDEISDSPEPGNDADDYDDYDRSEIPDFSDAPEDPASTLKKLKNAAPNSERDGIEYTSPYKLCSRLGKNVLEYNTFIYTCDNRYKSKVSGTESTYWKCENRKCKARVKRTGNRITELAQHTKCSVSNERLIKRQIQTTLRDKVIENIDLDSNRILEEFKKTFPSYIRPQEMSKRSLESIKRTIRRIKLQVLKERSGASGTNPTKPAPPPETNQELHGQSHIQTPVPEPQAGHGHGGNELEILSSACAAAEASAAPISLVYHHQNLQHQHQQSFNYNSLGFGYN